MRVGRPFLLSLILVGAIPSVGPAGEVIDPAKATTEAGKETRWYDLKLLDVEGRGWTDTLAFYDRLPAKAETLVREPVWKLSRDSAGMCARFVTDATAIQARWTLVSPNLAMSHMAATGVSGVDLYVKHEGNWRYLGTGRPEKQTNTVSLTRGLPPGEREFLLYLPLYNGVSSVEIGLAKDAWLAKAQPYPNQRKPIVFYGTSITQGGCASRTGMVHTAILQRRLNYPVINLGFSGNGRMEPELAQLLAELDPSVYVLDCLPNMSADGVAARVEPFVATLRRARPVTPILLVEDRSFANAYLVPSSERQHSGSRAALKAAYDRMTAAGIYGLHYLTGAQLLGDDSEATVDNSHPTDLGFVRQADAFEVALWGILADK
jgi:hypothetical protein